MQAPEPLKLRRILVPVDESRPAVNSLSVAAGVAGGTEATVVLAHVVEAMGAGSVNDEYNLRALYGDSLDDMQKSGEESLRRMAETGPFTGLKVETRLRFGDPARALLDIAAEDDVDLIVMGSHGRGAWGRMIMGSVSQRVIQNSKVPVVVVPPHLEQAEAQAEASSESRAEDGV